MGSYRGGDRRFPRRVRRFPPKRSGWRRTAWGESHSPHQRSALDPAVLMPLCDPNGFAPCLCSAAVAVWTSALSGRALATWHPTTSSRLPEKRCGGTDRAGPSSPVPSRETFVARTGRSIGMPWTSFTAGRRVSRSPRRDGNSVVLIPVTCFPSLCGPFWPVARVPSWPKRRRPESDEVSFLLQGHRLSAAVGSLSL